MGASQDKEAGSPSAEYAPYQNSTPSKETGVYQRQLPFDPRSPTDNIARTPIVIEDTSEALTELDPRSPTIGIERTPLTILSKGASAQVEEQMEVDANPQPLPPSDIAPLCLPEDTSDMSSTTPPKPTLLPSLDDLIQDIDAADVSPLLTNAEQPPKNTVEPTPMQTKGLSYPKKLFSSPHVSSAPPKSAPICRSPLGLVAVDTNSPRNIMQSKQRRQVAKSLGGFPGRMTVDKENMAH